MSINKNKKTCQLADFAIPIGYRIKIKKWNDRQILGSCQRAEKAVEHKGESNTNCGWCPWKNP